MPGQQRGCCRSRRRAGKGCHISLGSVIRAYCQIAAYRKVADGKVIYARRRKIDGVDNGALEDALYAFGFGNKCSYVRPFGAGHINETYAVYMPNEEGEDELMYVLQRVNKTSLRIRMRSWKYFWRDGVPAPCDS